MEIRIEMTQAQITKLESGRVEFDLHNEDEGHCHIVVTKKETETCYEIDEKRPPSCPTNCRIHS